MIIVKMLSVLIAENINYRTFVFSASIAKCISKSFIISALCYNTGNRQVTTF